MGKFDFETKSGREKVMSFEAYRAGILRLANEELGGGDIEQEIERLARCAQVETADVRADVTEAQDLLAD